MKINLFKSDLINLLTLFLINLYIILSLTLELILFNLNFVNQFIIVLTGFLTIISMISNKKFSFSFHKVPIQYVLFFILLFFIIINSIYVRNEIQFGALFNLLMGLFIGRYLAISRNSFSIIILSPFLILLIFILYKLSINLNPNEIFIRSRNYVSFFLIVTVIPYYFMKIKNNESFSFIPAFFTLILSFYSLGRSGILSSFILFIGVYLASKINYRLKKYIGFSIIILIIISFSFYLINYTTVESIERITNPEDWGELGGRSSFIENYINNSNLFSFLFGMDTDRYEILYIGGSYIPGHVHSSILNFISVTGIASFLFLGYLILKFNFIAKNNFSLSLILLALLFRISTETGLLFGYFDYVIWMFVFYDSNNKKNISKDLLIR